MELAARMRPEPSAVGSLLNKAVLREAREEMAPLEVRVNLVKEVGVGSAEWQLLAEARAHRQLAGDHCPLPRAFSRRYLLPFDTVELLEHRSDVLVIGSGIAGLVAALLVSRNRSVSVTTKATVAETGTCYAQGGIAGAVSEADSVELHLADTLAAGAGLCDERVVRAVVEEAPEALEALRDAGVRFDLAATGKVDLHREGGHSLPRVLHSGDATGVEIQNTLGTCRTWKNGLHKMEAFHVHRTRSVQENRARGLPRVKSNTGGRERP
ncbi:FAD-binding protein, partial [candidate division KSB1 bacterium]|nr:FAD-binding protein [candidate division KSB1 bacterium]